MTYHTTAGLPILHDRCAITGIKATLVRYGFRDCDVWGNGLAMATRGECLDAPSALPRGSTRGHIFTHCTGGIGPHSRAFVTQTTTGTDLRDDRT